MNPSLKNHYDTLIIGAGPAGMAAAYELLAGGQDFAVLEKATKVGGLAKTYSIKEGELEFRTDNGPHRFFSKNRYLYELIENVLGGRWLPVERQTRQYIDGKFFDYPVNAGQVLRNVGPWMVIKILLDYGWARLVYGIGRRPIKNFRDYLIANFGTTLAEFNMINYTEKIWGVSCENLHLDWAGQRITGLNLFSTAWNMVRKLFVGKNAGGPKSLVDVFYYPETGTGLIYETIKSKLEDGGKTVATGCQTKKIYHEGNRLTKVDITTADGIDQQISVDHLVESIPPGDFLQLLDPAPPQEVLAAVGRLSYRSQVYLFLTINKEQITPDQWIYFPKPEIPFARWSEMKNFSTKMSPPGTTSLFVEFFCDETDPIYNLSAEELFALSLPHFEATGLFTKDDVRHIYRFQAGKSYPRYTTDYNENLAIIKTYLDSFTNLYFIGRPGRFKYTNQDHSLEMGILAAKSIQTGKRLDIEDVGAEKEYFEKGFVANHTQNSKT